MTKGHVLHKGPFDSLQSSIGYKVMLTARRGEVGLGSLTVKVDCRGAWLSDVSHIDVFLDCFFYYQQDSKQREN
jgi:hypothetical protein